MIAVTGQVESIDAIHDAVRRMEEGAAQRYDQLTQAATLLNASEAAAILRSLAAAARRRAKTFAGSTIPVGDAVLPAVPALPPEGLDLTPFQALDLALDMEYAMLTMLEMLAALADTEAVHVEARKLAERKRLHLNELAQRQNRYAAPER